MRWWRHSALSRAVALIFLLWTATDLSNPSLCALDKDDAAPVGAASAVQGSTPPVAPQPASPHIDDCFCCSHCVDVARCLPADEVTIANRLKTLLALSAPRIFGSPLFHPPQISLQ
jgi:hypothetical protein